MKRECWFCRAEVGWNAFCPVCQEFRELPAREQAERATYLLAMPEDGGPVASEDGARGRNALWKRLNSAP